ncbi:MAG: NnrU family protein [Gammaproteobacteria bacterium]|nr:NnrU family protein [Gammaproteobacteria bacterium]
MSLLILGVCVFVGIHLVPSFPSLRQNFVDRLGEGAYKGGFALFALVGLVIIVMGKASAEFVPIWQAPAWGRLVAMVVMLPVFILLAAANMPTNIKRFTRHPMLWGVALWSVSHLLANGDLASLILFGSFGVFAGVGMWSANLRGATKTDQVFSVTNDVTVVVVGIVAYGIFLFLHPYLFGVPVIS